ncbi:hypothetical protein P692DRAFT_20837624 [Suillus brevipes Sb2]|nr:hypothetical protein P692DRAFT_20837624 [Suillus brevipes Sb2]
MCDGISKARHDDSTYSHTQTSKSIPAIFCGSLLNTILVKANPHSHSLSARC